MKKITKIILVNMMFASFAFNVNAQGILKASGNVVQIGYSQYKWLGFGFNAINPLSSQSQWGLEYWDGGFNFWKPWPSLNSGNYKMFIHDLGFVGINGKPDPGRTRVIGSSNFSNFRLQVFGNAIGNDWYTFSDSTLKENIINITNVIPQLMKMNPIEYNYKAVKLSGATSETTIKEGIQIDTNSTTDAKKRYGFTAQEVSRIFPNLADEFNENVGVVNYVGFVPLLVKGIQEQQKKIDTQAIQIQQLKQEIIDLKGKTVYTDVDKTKLYQNDPNPFRGITTINYFIDEKVTIMNAEIEIRNIMGILQTIVPLGDRSGLGQVQFDGSALPEGYYVFSLKLNGSIKDSKILLIGE